MTTTHILQQEERDRRKALGLPEAEESLYTGGCMVEANTEHPAYIQMNKYPKDRYLKGKKK